MNWNDHCCLKELYRGILARIHFGNILFKYVTVSSRENQRSHLQKPDFWNQDCNCSLMTFAKSLGADSDLKAWIEETLELVPTTVFHINLSFNNLNLTPSNQQLWWVFSGEWLAETASPLLRGSSEAAYGHPHAWAAFAGRSAGIARGWSADWSMARIGHGACSWRGSCSRFQVLSTWLELYSISCMNIWKMTSYESVLGCSSIHFFEYQ